MWSVYIDAVRAKLAQALIVFDRFHVVQHLNRAVDEVRRRAWRDLHGEEKSAFKRTRRDHDSDTGSTSMIRSRGEASPPDDSAATVSLSASESLRREVALTMTW